MAPTFLLFMSLLLSSLHPSDAQVIIGSSASSSPMELPIIPSPLPSKQTVKVPPWASFPVSRRSDVPIRAPVRDRLTTTHAVQHLQNVAHPTAQAGPLSVSGRSMQNLSSGPPTQPTASRSRTDTASLVALSQALANGKIKGSTPPLPTLPSTAGDKPVTAGNPEEGSVAGSEDDLQELGSDSTEAVMLMNDSPVPSPTAGDETTRHRQQAQTEISNALLTKTTDTKAAKAESPTVKPQLFVMTTADRVSTTPPTETRATLAAVVMQTTSRTTVVTGELTVNTPKPSDSVAATSPKSTTTTTGSTEKQPQTPGHPVTAGPSQNSTRSNTRTQRVMTTIRASVFTTTQEVETTSSPKTTNQTKKTAQLGRSTASVTARTGTSSILTAGVIPVTSPRFNQRNRSVLLHRPHQAPHSTSDPPPPADANPSPNATLLYWGDLSRTLAFAWELHVYGSATLFLLLFAGAALGLTLSPGVNCPHRGAVALANALLFAAGGLRSALFLIDPYGTRKFLPRPAVTAIYNLPLHMLVWTQAALALLALRVAGVSLLPSTLERPPLVAVLAVLQCTLLLAADLLSPALSPVVPVTLQVMSLCWGLGLCLGFLCYIFPHIRCPPPGPPAIPGGKSWTGSPRIGVILGRVLAVCAVLGALCCGLHVHATLWLYGLLGDWTRFNWGWWLVHFWARLLELAWGFSLLLLASWMFWRPRSCRGREEGETGDGRAAGDLPSPGQSTGSSHRHTCWSKIVQSLRGKPCRKSDSNGVGGMGAGGGGGGAGEVPNNWAGQERPGADISKSLIRNQNHEQATALPRYVKDSNRGREHRGRSAERGVSDGSTGSLLRLQTLGRPPQRSASGSLDQFRDTSLSLYEFDLRPPSPIDLTRSIDAALHREHLLGGGSLFHPLNPATTSQSPSPGSGVSQGPWLRRNSDPQLSESSDAATESSMPLGGSVMSSVPSRQVTAPPTPSHQGHRWGGGGSVPSSVSCPVSLRPSRTSTGNLGEDGVDDTRPFITPDSERGRGRAGRPAGSRSYLEVSRHDDSASVSSEIIDL